jgi:FtsH-binding integral membrane protein
MQPPAEHVHWLFAAGFLTIGLSLLAQAFVGEEVWRRRRWRAYLWPGALFLLGLFMWPVMVFFTNSAIHMLAHSSWAQVMMLAGGAHIGLVHGKLRNRYWQLTMPLAFVVSGAAFLIHEQYGLLFSRSAFVHHVCGWTLIVGAVFPLAKTFRPRVTAFNAGYALTFVVLAIVLFTARDVAPIFGHYSGGEVPHR